LGDGPFGSEIVGKVTAFQRKLEELVERRDSGSSNTSSVRPSVAGALAGTVETPESKVYPKLRQHAEEALAHLMQLPMEERSEYRQSIALNRPKLYASMLALVEEKSAESMARSDALQQERRQRMVDHEQAHALMDQATGELTEEAAAEIAAIKRASGE